MPGGTSAGASPGIEFTVQNVSGEEMKGHPKVKLSGSVRRRGARRVPPDSSRGVVLSWLLWWGAGRRRGVGRGTCAPTVDTQVLIWQTAISNPTQLLQTAIRNY